MSEVLNLSFESDCSITDLKEINSSFASGSLKVMYTGKNRNKSDISRHSVENALQSLYNVPIVCHWDRDAWTIGGHDIDTSADENGVHLINLTEPCGVVPESARFRFENSVDDNGNEHEYLVIDGVLLWKRQDVYNHIKDDLNGHVDHSMEITIKDGSFNKSSGYYEIRDFEFTALCLLESCSPCFEGSSLSLFSLSDFKEKLEQMMSELKETYSDNLSAFSKAEDIHPQEDQTKGGNIQLEDNTKLDNEELEKDFAEEEVEAPVEEHEEAHQEEHEEENFELNSNLMNEICRAFEGEYITDRWGEQVPHYMIVDHDEEKSEVYCWDSCDWLLYGFSYSMDGDKVVVNFESKKRMKYSIVEFDEGSVQESPFAPTFNALEEKFNEVENIKEQLNELNNKYSDANNTINSMSEELESLRKFKSDRDEQDAMAERDEVFSKFEDLEDIDAFNELKENCMNYSVDECEEKCFAIRGRHATIAKMNFSANSIRLPIQDTSKETEGEPYGGVVKKYLNK